MPTREEALQKYHEMTDIIAGVKRVLIIGGGPVGCELAGEILETNPKIKLTLVHGDTSLINSAMSDKLRLKTQEQLEQLGTSVFPSSKLVVLC